MATEADCASFPRADILDGTWPPRLPPPGPRGRPPAAAFPRETPRTPPVPPARQSAAAMARSLAVGRHKAKQFAPQRRGGLASGGMSAGRGRQMRIGAQASSPCRRHRFKRRGVLGEGFVAGAAADLQSPSLRRN